MVYLLHYMSALHHAQHYIGYGDTLARCQQHADGTSRAKLPTVLHSLGIPFQVVRTWDGDRKLERQLKKRKDARALCPICRPARLAGHAQRMRNTRARKRQEKGDRMSQQYLVTLINKNLTVLRLGTAVPVPPDATFVSTGANLNGAMDALAQAIYGDATNPPQT